MSNCSGEGVTHKTAKARLREQMGLKKDSSSEAYRLRYAGATHILQDLSGVFDPAVVSTMQVRENVSMPVLEIYLRNENPFECPECGRRTLFVDEQTEKCFEHGLFRVEDPDPEDHWQELEEL